MDPPRLRRLTSNGASFTVESGVLSRRLLHSLRGAVVALALLAPTTARSDETATATAVFREGQALLSRGQVAEACSKFVQSYQLVKGGGALIAAADCHERQGRTGSAWSEYLTARAIAKRDGRQDRIEYIDTRLSDIERHLVRVAVDVAVPTRDLPNVHLEIDGAPLPRGAWGTFVPVDPGDHVVTASAEGYTAFRRVLRVVSGDQSVRIDRLEPVPAALPPERPRSPAPQPVPPSYIPGAVVGIAGLALLGVGTAFGIAALDEASASRALCPTSPCADPDALSDASAARRNAVVSTATIVAGAASAAFGGYLILRARGGARRTLRLSVDRISMEISL